MGDRSGLLDRVLRRALVKLVSLGLRQGAAALPLALILPFYLCAVLSEFDVALLPPPPLPGVAILGAALMVFLLAGMPRVLPRLPRLRRLAWLENASGLPYQPLRTLAHLRVPTKGADGDPFRHAAVQFAEAQTSRMDLSRVVETDRRVSRRLFQASLAATLLASAAAVLSPERHVEWLALMLPARIAQMLPYASVKHLALQRVAVRVHPPAYAAWPPEEKVLGVPELQVLKGSRVELTASTREHLRTASLSSSAGTNLPAQVSGSDVFASFDVLAEQSLRIEGLGLKGEKWVSPSAANLKLIEDRRPHVALLQPPADMTAEETGRIPIQYSADDDFGLRRFELVLFRGKEESPMPLERLEGEPSSASGTYILELIQLQPKPGELIGIGVRAWDNDTVSGPKFGTSDIRFLEILSGDHEHRAKLEKLKAVWESLIQTLGLELPTTVAGMDGPGRLTAHQTIDARLRETSQYLGDVLGGIADDERMSADWIQILAVMKQDIETVNREKALFLAQNPEILGVPSSPRRSAEDEMKPGEGETPDLSPPPLFVQKVQPEVQELEEDVLLLDRFFDMQALTDAYTGFNDALHQQETLTDLLKQANLRDPKASAALERKLQELERTLASLYEKLMKTARQIPDELLNPEAMQSLKTAQLGDLMAQIREALRSGDSEKAQKLLAQLRDELQKLMTTVDSAQKGAQRMDEAQYEKAKSMYQSLEQLEKDQSQLRQETFEQSKAGQSGDARDAKVWIRQALEQIQRHLQSAEQSLSGMESAHGATDWTGRMRMSLENALALRAQLAEQLDRVAPRELLPPARSLEMALQGADQLTRWPPAEIQKADPPRKLASDVRDAEHVAKELVQFLQAPPETAPSPRVSSGREPQGEQGAPSGRSNGPGLTERQGRLAQSTGDLSKKLEELSGSVPFVGKNPSSKLGQAAEDMKSAQQALGRNGYSDALTPQDQAIQKIREAKGNLQQALNGMSSGAPGMSMPFPSAWPWGSRPSHQEGKYGAPTQKVQIPTSDQHKVPKEFREDLLEAMKEKYPDKYEKPVKKYYEELLK
ncbi:MAG: DUF4175 family protein [Nitrospirae bacterium]|nr:DUF4175 family protein [Nitrospirota bacterium]